MAGDRDLRILDAAEELLLELGYRKVNVEDIARRAGVGKGTVYLHWSSKLELFGSVLLRDAAGIVDELIAALRADPAEVQLHRVVRRVYLLVLRRPLSRAFYTGDREMLGELTANTRAGLRLAADHATVSPRYLGALYAGGLLLDDPAETPDLTFRLSAVLFGYFFLEGLLPLRVDLTEEARADSLATTVRRGFEPSGVPTEATLRAAAPPAIEQYELLRAEYARALPGERS